MKVLTNYAEYVGEDYIILKILVKQADDLNYIVIKDKYDDNILQEITINLPSSQDIKIYGNNFEIEVYGSPEAYIKRSIV